VLVLRVGPPLVVVVAGPTLISGPPGLKVSVLACADKEAVPVGDPLAEDEVES